MRDQLSPTLLRGLFLFELKEVADIATKGRPKSAKSDGRTEYYCVMCGKKYTKQVGNFLKVQTPLYQGNNGYMPVCRGCVDNLFEHYVSVLGSEAEAVRRICQKFDMYFHQSVFDMTEKTTQSFSRMSAYCSKLSLRHLAGKTYDDTILDEVNIIESVEEVNTAVTKVLQRTVKLFGPGFTPEEYKFLQDQYDDWTTRCECQSKAQEELFKTIAIAQLNVLNAQQGKGRMKINDAMRTFQDLLGTAKLKPNQTNDNTLSEQNTFGVLIKKWEDEEPIMEPKPEWQDVDGIVRYITVYFLGHLCKMMGVKNKYSHMYEVEMEKYRVERPEYEDDDEALFDAVFGGDDIGDE